MVILDATVMPIGRLLVHDDCSIEEVLYVPNANPDEVTALGEMLLEKKSVWGTYGEALVGAVGSLYGLDNLVEIHSSDEPELVPEPDIGADS